MVTKSQTRPLDTYTDATIAARLRDLDEQKKTAEAELKKIADNRTAYLNEATRRGLDCVEAGTVTYTAKGTFRELYNLLGPDKSVSIRISQAEASTLPKQLYQETQSWKVVGG